MSLRIGIPLVTVATLSLPLFAQTRPNLAGTWQPIPEKSTGRPANAPPMPTLTISQASDGTTITISNVAYSPLVSGATVTFDRSAGGATPAVTPGPPLERREFPFTQTYVCDGQEHPEPERVPPMPPIQTPALPAGARVSTMTNEVTYRAAWTGDQFVLTTRSTPTWDPPMPNLVPTTRTTRKTYSINSEGLLVVESLTTADSPANGAAQPPPTPTRNVYRKGP